MPEDTDPNKMLHCLSNGRIFGLAKKHPAARRFLDAFGQLADADKITIDALLTWIQDNMPGIGPLGAIELLMYISDWRISAEKRDRNGMNNLRLGHALEQNGWPEKAPAVIAERI